VRVGIYDRFWHSMGGGERHAGMVGQIMSQAGHEVDLIGHSDVSLRDLGDRVALDLSRTRLRVRPDRGEDELSDVTAEYDLLVNATYMSRLVSKARHSAYLCFFPTPFDHDLGPVHRAAVGLVGPHLAIPDPQSPVNFRYGKGWYPPEGGRRRQWAWSNGTGRLDFGPGGPLELEADFGRPGAPEPTMLTVEASGAEVQHIEVPIAFTRQQFHVPASNKHRELRLTSNTFTPGVADPRSLGVAMSRLRVLGGRMSARERMALRYPWLLRNPKNLDFLDSYDVVLANSAYTQTWIEALWGTHAEILFPPIEIDAIHVAPVRDRVILSVGRFFAPGYGHCKRQLEMVRMFGDLVRSGALPGWRFAVVGGCEENQRPYLEAVTASADGLPVDIHANAPRSLVESLMSTSAIFWSATGYGENTDKRPWTNEHFGMTTAEAMAGGCVPVVIDRAGQREIVREGVDGFRWADPQQLRIRTVQVATDEPLRDRLSAAAVQRAQIFSDDAFAQRWDALTAKYSLVGP
jgi:glycosyltransferase involved in cell wall biosynthesis